MAVLPSRTLALNSEPKQQRHRRKRTRKPNRRAIKIHRNYTVEQAASVTGYAKGTIRRLAGYHQPEADSDPWW
jgi:hypothetical protein